MLQSSFHEQTPTSSRGIILFYLQEIAARELNNLKGQKQNLENEIVTLKARADELHALYDEQEGLLNEIFGGMHFPAKKRFLLYSKYIFPATLFWQGVTAVTRRTVLSMPWISTSRCGTGSWRPTSSGDRPSSWWTTLTNSLSMPSESGWKYRE